MRLEKTVGELPSDVGLIGSEEGQKEIREIEMIERERLDQVCRFMCQFIGDIQMHGVA